MGVIRGSVEPGETSNLTQIRLLSDVFIAYFLCNHFTNMSTDRYVIYGNHRDSWVHGAIDPSSGTAVMLEITRVLGRMVKQGEKKYLAEKRNGRLMILIDNYNF